MPSPGRLRLLTVGYVFTKRHEQEIAEIKGLTYELGARLEEIVEQLERIREVQEQLIRGRSADERAPVAEDPATSEPTPKAVAKAARKAARANAQSAGDAKPRQGKPSLKRRRAAGHGEPAASSPAKDE